MQADAKEEDILDKTRHRMSVDQQMRAAQDKQLQHKGRDDCREEELRREKKEREEEAERFNSSQERIATLTASKMATLEQEFAKRRRDFERLEAEKEN